MKAVILAAGKGTRLRPLTDTRPKALIPVAGKTLLQLNIELATHSGIREIIVVVDAEGDEMIRRAIGDGSKFEAQIDIVAQEKQLGTAHAVHVCASRLNGKPFVVVFCDNVTDFALTDLLAAHDTRAIATLALKHTDLPRRFGIAQIDANRILRVEEHPEAPGHLTLAGMYVFEPEVLDAVEKVKPSRSGERYLPDAIQMLIESGEEVGYCICDNWRLNVNSPEELLAANRYLLERKGSGFRGQGAHVAQTARVGPFVSIGEGCRIEEGATIENSILLDHVVVSSGAKLSGCILGEGARVWPGTVAVAAHEPIVIGDRMELGNP